MPYFGAEYLWVTAIIAATAFAVDSARRLRLDAGAMYVAACVTIASGIAGAALLGRLDYGPPHASWNLLAQGKSSYGGLIGGAAAMVAYLRWRRLSIGRYGDLLFTAVALGYCLGRIGCFFNGCDYGVRTGLPWAVQYPPGTEAYADHLARGWIAPDAAASLAVHPVQLYAAICGAVIFVVLVRTPVTVPGARVVRFALLYGAYRFLIEWLRGDFRAVAGPFSLPQVLSLVAIVAGVTGWWLIRQQTRGERPAPLSSVPNPVT